MQFGVLGSLAVWARDGRPVALPERKARLLLADLLVHDGGPLATDRLIEDLWGDRPPRDPAAVLRSKVSQLRRALEDAEPGGRDLLVHDGTGYRLAVQRPAIDACRFADLVDVAREAGDPGERAAILSSALGLWRGRALADLSAHELTWPAVARLEEARLAAVEDRLGARLDLGEHAAVVAELAGLVAEHPFREQLRALHVRTLYRCGRQGEALDSYEALRLALLDRGLAPSPALAALQVAVLRQDPTLDAEPPPARGPGPAWGRGTAEGPGPAGRHRAGVRCPATRLVGRADVLRDVRSALGSDRLVTLVGPGGVGKTRLAVAVASGWADDVWFVELAALAGDDTTTEADAAAEVARALDLREGRGAADDPAGRVGRALASRPALLVLDDCEHVARPVARLADGLLQAAPWLRILATSREPLRVPAEVVWPVPPLGVPRDDPGAVDPAGLSRSAAVELFVARARAAALGFTLDADTAPAVATICRRLDGIPLALEMAASKVRTVGVHELARRLDDRFRLLGPGARTAPARHRTLRTVIDWSWHPLPAGERAVLRRLSLAAGGYDVETAEHVCAGDSVDRTDVLPLLASLVDRSLAVFSDGPGGPRYRLLETVGAYASERLDEAGERDRAQQRHDCWFAGLAEAAAAGIRGPDQRRWLDRVDAETRNVRRALDGATRRRDAALALRLANALTWPWYLRGRFREARRCLDQALACPGPAPAAARDEASAALAGFAWMLDRRSGPPPTASAPGEPSDAGEPGDAGDPGRDPASQARQDLFLAFAYTAAGDPGTVVHLAEAAHRRFSALGDEWGVAACRSVRAFEAVTATGDLAAARRDAEAARAAFRNLGDRWGELVAVQVLDTLAEIAGDYARAGDLAGTQCRIAEDLGLPTELSYALSRRGRLALLTGDVEAADHLHRRARRVAREQGNSITEEIADVGLALAARRAGDLDRAEALLDRWLGWHRSLGYQPGLALYLTELGFVAELRGDAATARRRHAEALTAARALGEPRAIARALEGLAGALSLVPGHEADATRLLEEAAALRADAGAPLPPAERGDVDRIAERLRATTGDGDTVVARLT
jgi:predicted ATPase/DNA-binding SARP family transcriptional activator